ncbi:ACTR6 [Symbiodinium sp. CCMP2592]|nr:ACTR6 [Symbiodinium sp. CCMP2592]
MGMFVLYSFQEDAFWRIVPGTKRARELDEAWREHPLFANSKDPLDGLINPDDYEKGLEEAWERAKPAGSTVVVILPPLTPAFIKDDVLRMLVEHMGFAQAAAIESGSVALQSPGLVALLQQNPSPCCTVLNLGFSSCFAQPSIEGLAIESAGRRLNVGGRVLTNLLLERLKLQHFNLSESWLLVEDILKRTGEVLRNLGAALTKNFSGVAPLTYVLPDFEEDMAGYVQEEPSACPQDANSGRQHVTLTAERVVIPEALFRPQDHGLPLCGLPELVYAAILAVPEETWRPHFGRVVLCGGLARLPGLASRLRLDLRQLLPSHWPVEVIVEEEPELSFWRGAAQHALNSDELWDEARQRAAPDSGTGRRPPSDGDTATFPAQLRKDLSIPPPLDGRSHAAAGPGEDIPDMSSPHLHMTGERSDFSPGGSAISLSPNGKGRGKGKAKSGPSGRRVTTATIIPMTVNCVPVAVPASFTQPDSGAPIHQAEEHETMVGSPEVSNATQLIQKEHFHASLEVHDDKDSAVDAAPAVASANELMPPALSQQPSDASPASSSPASGLAEFYPDLPEELQADLREEGFSTWTPTRKRLKRKAPASDYVQLRKGTG